MEFWPQPLMSDFRFTKMNSFINLGAVLLAFFFSFVTVASGNAVSKGAFSAMKSTLALSAKNISVNGTTNTSEILRGLAISLLTDHGYSSSPGCYSSQRAHNLLNYGICVGIDHHVFVWY